MLSYRLRRDATSRRQHNVQRHSGLKRTGRYPAGCASNQIIAVPTHHLKTRMVHVGHKRNRRHATAVAPGDAGYDVAEPVGAPRHADLGQRPAHHRRHAVLVKSNRRLRSQPGQKIQRPAIGIQLAGTHLIRSSSRWPPHKFKLRRIIALPQNAKPSCTSGAILPRMNSDDSQPGGAPCCPSFE